VYDVNSCTWRQGPVMGSPQYGNESFGSINEKEISLPAKCLESSQGLCSMALVDTQCNTITD